MSKAVFLDRDGTINVEKNYLYRIEDWEYLPGVKEGLRLLQDAGYLMIIITNQSGIARGYYTEEDYFKLNSWMLYDLEKSGINITATYYCPHHPDADIITYRKNCKCRKPGKELFEKAILEYGIDITKSYAIGDKIRDLTMCGSRGCKPGMKGYLLYSSDEQMNGIYPIGGGLFEAAQIIVNQVC